MVTNIEMFLDEEGKIKQFPSKRANKQAVCEYLAQRFELDKEYTEKEVNAIIDEWHTFGDYFLLRRELVESGWMQRLPDGSKYWKIDLHPRF